MLFLRSLFHLFLVVALVSLAGCRHSLQCYHQEFPYTRYPLPEELPMISSDVQVALVLGGGGARGMAHIGVLEEFEKAHIPIDMIVGCSIGSLVGAFYSHYPKACALKGLFDPIRRHDFIEIDFTAMRYGLGRGDPLKRFLLRYLGPTEFRDLEIPFIVVATDLCSGELILIGSGPIAPAIQASCAFPLVFAPVVAYERVLVDGGVVNPVPVDIAKPYNPKLIIAIDLDDTVPFEFPDNLFGIAKCCTQIKFRKQSQSCAKNADVVIRPMLGDVGLFQNGVNEKIYEAGREAAREVIPSILAMMRERGIECR